MKLTEVRKKLEAGAFAEQFEMLYGNQAEELARQKKRYLDLVDRFEKQFPGREDVRLYSAPDAPKSAATIPTISTAVYWQQLSIWMSLRLSLSMTKASSG